MADGDWAERGAAFDGLSKRVAAAYAAGDERTARRIGDEAVRDYLFPRVRELSQMKVFRRDLAEDVAAQTLLRIAADWRKGKAATWPMLQRIVVNCAVDLTRRDERAPTVDLGMDDEAQLEAFLAAEGAEARVDITDEVLDRVRVDELVDEFRRLRRPRWAAYVQAWRDGYRSAPDVEHVTGIKQGRVRQIKMDLCQYLRAYHEDVAPWFGCIDREAVEAAAASHEVTT